MEIDLLIHLKPTDDIIFDYSHTFEHIFETDHEEMTRTIITSEDTQINAVLKQVAPDFPKKVASVIAKTYPNLQVVQMISSQIDAD